MLYLPPELVGARGAGAWDWRQADRYSLGVLLHQSVYPPGAAPDPATALVRAVNGTLLDADRRRGTDPFWLGRIAALKAVTDWVRRLTATNPAHRAAGYDLSDIGGNLEVCGLRLAPGVAVQELLASDAPTAALGLIQEVLLTDETYEHLVLAARTAVAVERPLEALDLLERAAARDGTRPEARRTRVALLARAAEFPALGSLFRTEGERFDGIVWADYHALAEGDRPAARESLAHYLVWRGQYADAARHIFDWLFDVEGAERKYRWFDLPLNAEYGWALLGLVEAAHRAGDPSAAERLRRVRQHVATCKESISFLIRQGTVDGSVIGRCGKAINDIEFAVLRLDPGHAPPGPHEPEPPGGVP